MCFTSLAGSAQSLVVAAVAELCASAPVLLIAESADAAGYFYHDITRVLGEEAVAVLPSAYKRDIRYGQIDAPSVILRTDALARWSSPDGKLKIIITTPEAISELVAPTDVLQDSTLHIARHIPLDLTRTEKWLRENGFVQVDYVYEPGQFSVRGSILDIFSYSSEIPYRIDLFGDEIESMRTFNVETQLSEGQIESADIIASVDSTGEGIPVTDFMAEGTLVVTCDMAYVESRIKEVCESVMSTNAIVSGEADEAAIKRLADGDTLCMSLQRFPQLTVTAGQSGIITGTSIDFNCVPQGVYHKNFDMISEAFRQFMADGYKIYILTDSPAQADRLRDIFADRGDEISFKAVGATLHEGFVDVSGKRCFFTDHQIFDRFHKYMLRSDRVRSGKLALSIKELQSIEPGDFIVHIDHGVGVFGGLLRTNVNGRTQEMIKLTYQNNDVIFVSIHSLHKLAKYRGKEGVPPKVNKLGSGAWNRVKEKTKSKLKDIARDLIKLYAARRDEKGFAFSPDGYMQHELEASFIYEDTPDQMTATADVKRDMESQRPMDRLICGDVGFGKTEIAVRAAFKAAADGKQTAVLVPTTVLAYQHYRTFTQRLKGLPVRVDYLSRARTPRQVKMILEDLSAGKIDIIVGTHKLIGKSVKFKDLGLLVVDEEQKFGVAVKEKLKQLKVNVDTLTMSATPIPRTLQFSLMGARDLSAITTPPPNRYPIMTSVSPLTDDLVAEAVGFELSRNGQVFFISNRIEGLYDLQNMVGRLVPGARTLVAHGQMPPEKLEEAILAFANHDYDVLLSTTIVESGIDMPNVNTIIINNAQNFGLSELHQLRGRVGRSARKAFCYLTVPPGKPIPAIARRRLQAIESFSDLGSGIHIAMQDLDIRGAGNLLGAEQSGFIADLGYETYQKILKEAVTELRTQEFADVLPDKSDINPDDFVTDCVIESDMELLFPFDYVPQESERISLYQELDNIEKETDLQAFKSRLRDRFGNIPDVAAELIRIPRLRRIARTLGIEKVVLKQGSMFIYFVDESNKAYYQSPMFGRLIHYLQDNPRRVRIREKNGKRSFAIAGVERVEEA
ncbi:MAG: transcription-repair coupling factor, partial [Muribaculaceae bacterium]|nr:transcription-repair coupling factor [Muribaculaceae bacterium]